MRLYQLPDGTWVDPETIRCIRMHPRSRGSERGAVLHAPRVVIWAGDTVMVVDCESEEDAEMLRDQVAAVVNGGERP
jgi:hypothetical protein